MKYYQDLTKIRYNKQHHQLVVNQKEIVLINSMKDLILSKLFNNQENKDLCYKIVKQ